MMATDTTELPAEVGDFLAYLDTHARGDLSPTARERLTEVQRRRRSGLLTAPIRRARGRRPGTVRRAYAGALAVMRLYGLFVIAAILTAGAMWDIARPLGLLTAALGVIYLEYRIEHTRGEHVREHSQ